ILLLLLTAPVSTFGGGFRALGWGDNNSGQLNIPRNAHYEMVAAGGFQTLLAHNEGSIFCGASSSDQVIELSTNGLPVCALAAGYSDVLVLHSDHTLVAFGSNDHGQTNIPAGFTNFAAIAAGVYHSLAVLPDGTVIGSGDNYKNFRAVPIGLSNVIAV